MDDQPSDWQRVCRGQHAITWFPSDKWTDYRGWFVSLCRVYRVELRRLPAWPEGPIEGLAGIQPVSCASAGRTGPRYRGYPQQFLLSGEMEALMERIPSTPEREAIIRYLVNRAYPRGKYGVQKTGWRVFEAALHEQPDNVLNTLYEDAKKEQKRRNPKLL